MFYIIKDWKIFSSWSSEMIQDWIKSVEINFTEQELEKLNKWCLYENWKVIETPEYLAEIEKENLEKINLEKKQQIEKIATLSDQLNLLASTLDVVVSYIEKTDSTIANNDTIIKSRNVLKWIKNILENN